MLRFPPAEDLPAALAPLSGPVRTEMLVSWVDRLLCKLAPEALRRLQHHDDAAELLEISRGAVSLAGSGELCKATRALSHRLWPEVSASEDRRIAHDVVASVDDSAGHLALEAGAHVEVFTKRSGSGQDVAIALSPDEIRRHADQHLTTVGCHARAVAHVARGEQGFREEVAWQYGDLRRVIPGETGVAGDVWGDLKKGKRYRVYSAFVDLDGRPHVWGESWQFDGYVFCPGSCELTLMVRDGIQLDPRGTPSHEIPVQPFRLALTVGDRAGYAHDPVRPIITND